MEDLKKLADEIGKRSWYSGMVNTPGFVPGITIRQRLIADGMKIAYSETLKSRPELKEEFLNNTRNFADVFAQQTLLAMAEAEGGNND